MKTALDAILILFLLLFLLNGPAFAGGGPENVLLIVNAESDASKLVANYYVDLRMIHSRNVVYLKRIPNQETINYATFKAKIIQPILKVINNRRLNSQIDYIVYSADFPTRIKIDRQVADFKKRIAKAGGPRNVPNHRRMFDPYASLNAATYFAQRAISNDSSFVALDANKYMRTRNMNLLRTPFYGQSQEKFEQAVRDAEAERFETAVDGLEELAQQHPQQVAVLYWMARVQARTGNAKKSAEWLEKAVAAGWNYRDFARSDAWFDNVKDDPALVEVVNKMPDDDYRFLPTHGFKKRYYWGPNGMINGSNGQGETYVLSTVLAVTRNQGTSERDAIRQLRASVNADGTKPKGTFYFMATGDVRSRTRQPMFKHAIRALESLGQTCQILKAKMPEKKDDILGLVAGTANFVFKNTQSSIVPGSICESLTSFGGALQMGTKQTKLSEFIRYGAAGSCGTVCEPLAIPNKFPDPRVHVHYVRGCSLAESFYQAVHGPFQLLIVGDALCQPFATFPKITASGLSLDEPVSGTVDMKLDFSSSPVNVAAIEVYLDGMFFSRMEPTQKFRFDSKTMPDGFHELRFVAIANHAIETTGRAIVPFLVDNENKRIKLTVPERVVERESIAIEAKANFGDRIEIRHNRRVIAKAQGQELKVELPAMEVGRGPVHLQAFVYENEQRFRSAPQKTTVLAKLKRTIPKTRLPRAQRKRPAK